MTQRTVGLVTYTEEVVRATVKRGDEPVAGVTVGRDAGLYTFGVWSGGEDLSRSEAMALYGALGTLLGFGEPLADESEASLCENCGKEPSSAITADDVWLCKGCSASLDEEHRDRLATRRVAERIIARLRKAKYTGVDRTEYPDQPYTINQAIRIVREECGVAE